MVHIHSPRPLPPIFLGSIVMSRLSFELQRAGAALDALAGSRVAGEGRIHVIVIPRTGLKVSHGRFGSSNESIRVEARRTVGGDLPVELVPAGLSLVPLFSVQHVLFHDGIESIGIAEGTRGILTRHGGVPGAIERMVISHTRRDQRECGENQNRGQAHDVLITHQPGLNAKKHLFEEQGVLSFISKPAV